MTKHGHTSSSGGITRLSPTYMSYMSMHQRTSNPKHDNYAYYGGRGIKVCKRWKKCENFLADMGERPEGKTLDRKDNNKGYSPSNCKWSTAKEQRRNQKMREKYVTNKSGVLGVYKHSTNSRYCASIQTEGKSKHLGCRATAIEASLLYQEASSKLAA